MKNRKRISFGCLIVIALYAVYSLLFFITSRIFLLEEMPSYLAFIIMIVTIAIVGGAFTIIANRKRRKEEGHHEDAQK